jgi:polyhydroxyalkanoate synthase
LGESVEPLIEPEVSDNRFKDQDWSTPYFDSWKQAYLITSRWAEDMLKNTEGLDAQTRRQAEFHFRQISSALSPSNFPLTNPEVVRETFATNAKNLLQGMTHFAEDMEKSGDLLKVSQTDHAAFEVGRNLAVTTGKVIFQNDLLQLIQYVPATETVRELPLLIVPPWINKFYILDLTPAKSLVRFLVGQGFTVFMISWVNPDKHLSHKSFEDYMQEGLLTAAEAVRRETASSSAMSPAIASAARCSRPRSPILRRAGTSLSPPQAFSRPRSTSRMPATSCCSPAKRSWRLWKR